MDGGGHFAAEQLLMPLSFRHYIFQDDGALKRVPRRIVDALPFGTDAILEYAGTKQKVAQVILDNEAGRPVQILDVTGYFWTFDQAGKVDENFRRELGEWMDFAFSPASRNKTDGRVVDLVPELKRKDLHKRHRWTVTNDELDLIAADIWPGIHGPAPDVETVKGKAPKKPPLTREARWALQEIEKHVEGIKSQLGGLSERALKGLAFEAIRMNLWDDEALWRAVADQAKRQEAIRAAHRTGRGEWYAVLERARSDRDKPYLWEQISVAHERCASRAAAVEAGKRLMAEKAAWLDADIEISVTIWSALEWRPDDWE